MAPERDIAIASARHLLESRAAEPEAICKAIVGIGKPYDAEIIRGHAALVATCLNHPDHVVRYQALWFLGSWGHLPEYASRIKDIAHTDLEVENRAYAARSLGSILRQEKNPLITKSLLVFVEDEKEEIEVRFSAYSGLLYAWNGDDVSAFQIGDKTISDMDLEFVAQLHAWIEGTAEMPPVKPSRGVFGSLIRAVREGSSKHASLQSG